MKVSVILPIYNAEQYLEECLKSIYRQTFKDYELIAIDDGSTDNSLDILERYRNSINNMTIISRENKGLAFTLNEAIKISKGEFICRMDADDVMIKNRIKIQYEFLINNQDYVACGSSYEIIGDIKNKVILPTFKSANEALAYMLFENPFVHPTMMIRKSIFEEFSYSEEAIACEP
jgi:glycosyltransferase involved in cell wall biosynthesis